MKKSLFDQKNVGFLLLIAFVVSVPLMTDYVLMGDSTASSLARIEAVCRSLGKVFPIRVGTMGADSYGYSMAAFQADVFYLIPALFRFIGVSLGNSFKLAVFIFNILTAFIAFGSFEKIFGDRRLGLVAAMLFTWCPYRITSLYTAGNLSEVFAWTFVPVLFLGIWKLYGEDDGEGGWKPWVVLSVGFSLIALSSTVFLFIFSAMAVVFFVLMWRKSFSRKILVQLFKTIICVVTVNAWFLVPMLLRMRDANAVGAMLAGNVQELGMNFAQYLTVFNFAGSSSSLWESGMKGARALEPGAAVTALIFVYLYLLFTGRVQCKCSSGKEGVREGGKCISGSSVEMPLLCVCLIGIILSTNTFPWCAFQNRNMLFSIILALMENPARWGIAADVCLIAAACCVLKHLKDIYDEKTQLWIMLLTVAVSFGTTQFLLGNILKTHEFAWDEDIAAFGGIQIPVIYGESMVWRLCEIVSLVSISACAVIWLIRRRKSVKKV